MKHVLAKFRFGIFRFTAAVVSILILTIFFVGLHWQYSIREIISNVQCDDFVLWALVETDRKTSGVFMPSQHELGVSRLLARYQNPGAHLSIARRAFYDFRSAWLSSESQNNRVICALAPTGEGINKIAYDTFGKQLSQLSNIEKGQIIVAFDKGWRREDFVNYELEARELAAQYELKKQ